MQYLLFFICFSALTLTSYLACRYLIYFSHKHAILDETTQRSSHSQPTPRIGGLSFATLILLSLSILLFFNAFTISKHYYLSLLIPPFLVAAISIIDDVRKGLSRTLRLSTHLFASVVALLFIGSFSFDFYSLVTFCIFVVSVAWFINLFNFMDGIDGIAATQAIFIIASSAGFSFLAEKTHWGIVQLIILAPILGFAFINWQPAKIFMGDVGSTFLGILIPICLIISVQQNVLTAWSAIILTSTFLVDASCTLMTRFTTGQKWHEPHRSHLYQILSRKSGSHSKVCIWNAILNVGWVLPNSFAAYMFPKLGQLFTLLALLPILILCIIHRSGQIESN